MDCDRTTTLSLLGAVATEDAARVAAALRAIDGPPVTVQRRGGVAVFAQRCEHRTRARRQALAESATAAQRQQRASDLTSFLPASPATRCLATEWPGLVARAAPAISEALGREGALRQWCLMFDAPRLRGGVTRCLARLRATLHPFVVDASLLRAGADRAATGLALLVHRDSAVGLARAVSRLPAAVTAGHRFTLHGPRPPLGFLALSIARTAPDEVLRAWSLLALRDAADARMLARRWQSLAFAFHPALGGEQPPAAMAETTRAYRLLGELARPYGEAGFTKADILREASCRIVVPAARTGALEIAA